jgi:uncharacterized FlaG/YvyC family protein
MDVQTVASAGSGQSTEAVGTQGAGAAQSVPGSSSTSSAQQNVAESTIAAAVAKIYNVTQSGSGEPVQLSVSYQYVSQLQLVVTVFTNPQTGEEVAQFPPQELIGLAELFDQIDGVTLDRKV